MEDNFDMISNFDIVNLDISNSIKKLRQRVIKYIENPSSANATAMGRECDMLDAMNEKMRSCVMNIVIEVRKNDLTK